MRERVENFMCWGVRVSRHAADGFPFLVRSLQTDQSKVLDYLLLMRKCVLVYVCLCVCDYIH